MSYYYEAMGDYIGLATPLSAKVLREIEAGTDDGIVVLWPNQKLIATDDPRQDELLEALEPGQEAVDPWDLAPFVIRAHEGEPVDHPGRSCRPAL